MNSRCTPARRSQHCLAFQLLVAASMVLGSLLHQRPAGAQTAAQATSNSAASLASAAASDGTSVALDASSPHAWLLAPAGGGFPAAVMHLPARDGELNTAGTLKLANVLTEQPLALLADENRVLIILPASRGDGPMARVRRVVSMTATRNAGGTWEYRPLGRTAPEPELPGSGKLIDVCASAGGPVVLLGPVDAEASPAIGREILPPTSGGGDRNAGARWRLMRLTAGKWLDIPLPGVLTESAGPVVARLTSGRAGIASLWVQQSLGATEAAVWLVPTDSSQRPEALTNSPVPTGGLSGSLLLGVDGTILSARVTAESVAISTSAGGVWRRLTTVPRPAEAFVGGPVSVVGISGVSRIAVVSAEAAVKPAPRGERPQNQPVPTRPNSDVTGAGSETEAEPATPDLNPPRADLPPIDTSSRSEMRSIALAANRAFTITEVSAVDGRTMFGGPARRDGVVTTRDFHVLTLAFSSLMVAVLLFVLRSDRQPVLIPPGASLASGPKRAIATLIDATTVALLSGPLLGVKLAELFSVQILLSPGGVLSSVLAIMALGAVYGAVSEALWGRTLGKFMTDCEVIGFRRIKPSSASGGAAEAPKGPKGTDGARDTSGADGTSTNAPVNPQNPAPSDSGASKEESAAGEGPANRSTHRIGSFEVGGPTVWQASARNAVKWLLWPLTLVALFDASGRHPGDVISGTVVVEWPDGTEGNDENDEQ